MPISRAFSTYPSWSPTREPSLWVPFTELPQRGTPHLQSPFQLYLKVPSRWAHSRLPNWAPKKRDAHPQSFLFITFRAPSKGAPPPHLGSLTELPLREITCFQIPLTTISQSSQWMDPPCGNVCPLCPPPRILLDPQKGAPTPIELPQREMLPFQSPPTIS